MILKEFANVLSGDAAAVTPTGSAAGDAAVITAKTNVVTGADGTKGVILTDGDVGTAYLVYSATATNALKVYPPTGDAIDAGSASAAKSCTARKPNLFVKVDDDQWLSIESA